MKLYEGGLSWYWKPEGEKVVTVLPRVIELATLQFSLGKASLSFVVPVCAAALIDALPHVKVTVAGDVSWTTAHK